eukprot:tig00000704_g3325.t1
MPRGTTTRAYLNSSCRRHHLTRIEALKLRQNLIEKIEGLSALSSLKHLDLYGNRLTSAETGLESLASLTHLDLSYNEMRSMGSIKHMTELQTLYLCSNKISSIDSATLACLTKLKTLELGSNRIREINGLDKLCELENLWLGRNKISCIERLSGLPNLQRLSLQSNRITKLAGLEALVNLTELYLSHNGISKLEGFDTLVCSYLSAEDPREAILKYAKAAEEDPFFTKAYQETQPKAIFDLSQQEEEQEGGH